MISALYVQTNGSYFNLEGVDPWDKSRDAKLYDGDYSVVAHPPCQLWGALASVNYARWGGDHNRPGNDNGCFESALKNVRRCGGVLEHPAKTRAWYAHGIIKPPSGHIGWFRIGLYDWVCEVWQSAYGHRANKATWLYYYGINNPFELRWSRPKGTHQVGQKCMQGIRQLEPWRNKPSLSKKESNATPIEFRDELLKLAMLSKHEKNETKKV